MNLIFIFQIVVLIFSVVIHEVSHGYAANELGDPTAKLSGRLTLNPLKHLDPFGSVILPILLALIPGGVIFGWAKPVPFNPMNLKDPKKGGALIALAGPASNFIIAGIFAAIFRIIMATPALAHTAETTAIFFVQIVIINIMLGVFNLIPIPPLDGSKILFGILPRRYEHLFFIFERYGMFILLFLVFFAFKFLTPVVFFIYRVFMGV